MWVECRCEKLWYVTYISVRSVVFAAGSSAIVTAATMPIVIHKLKKLDRLDRPNARSSHVKPTPRGGGLACAAGIVAGVGAARAFGVPIPSKIVGGSLILTSLGYLDDRVGLSASMRLGAQVVVGAVCGASMGGNISGAAIGAGVVPVVVNAFNFMDGVNGISAGQVVVWAGSALPVLLRSDSAQGISVVASTIGAGLSFIPWNVPTAQVFLGDVGSYLFGSIIALVVISVFVRDAGMVPVILAPYLIYLADTGWTLAVRTHTGERLTDAHRSHTYQKLSDLRGVEHWHVAAGVSAASAACALLSRKASSAAGIPLLIAAYLSLPSFVARLRP